MNDEDFKEMRKYVDDRLFGHMKAHHTSFPVDLGSEKKTKTREKGDEYWIDTDGTSYSSNYVLEWRRKAKLWDELLRLTKSVDDRYWFYQK